MGPERDRLFESDSKTLTFGQALEVTQKAACARQARADVVVKEEQVFHAHAGGRRDARSTGAGTGESRAAGTVGAAPGRKCDDAEQSRCAVCGLKNHNASQCRFIRTTSVLFVGKKVI